MKPSGLAQETVVHVHAHQVLADGTDEQRRADAGVHAAGEGQQDLLVANLFADGFHLLVDKGEGEFFVIDARHGFGADIAGHLCLLERMKFVPRERENEALPRRCG